MKLDRRRRLLSLALGALGGGVYGAALARALFEGQPIAFASLADWPGALLVMGLGALMGGLIAARGRSPWASIALVLPLVGLLTPEVDRLRSTTLLLGAAGLLVALEAAGWESAAGDRPLSFGPWSFTLRPKSLPSPVAACLLFALLLALYLRTLAPAVGEADAFEFQVSVARLGIAHGNGYPLLLLVGKFFELLPLGGTQAWRVNVSAAVAAAAAAVGVMAIARRLGVARLPALLAALAFGAAPSLWARAIEIEAYALNAALMTISLYLGLTLIDPLDHASNLPPPASRLYALAFVFGLSLTNHLTSVLMAPAVAIAGVGWLVSPLRSPPDASRPLSREWPRVVHSVLVAVVFCLLGLSVYLYLPLRWPAVGGGEPFTLEKFVFFIRGGEAAAQFDPWLPLKEPQRFGYVFRKLTAEFSLAGFALALIGLVSLPMASTRRPTRWPAALFLLLALLGHVYFVLAYNPPEPDFSDFFIAPYVVVAVFIALGLQFLLANFQRPHSLAPLLSTALLAAFTLIPLSSIWTNLPRLDLSQNHERYRMGQYTLSQPLARGATILADPKRFAAPYYLQITEGVRPDLDIVVLPDEAAYRAVLDERIAAGRTVYLARYLAGLGSSYSLRSVGPLAEVSPAPFTDPPAAPHPLDGALASGIRLVGYGLQPPTSELRFFFLTLYWHSLQTPPANLAVYLRLSDRAGKVAWQSLGSVPVNGLYPTNAWRPGEYVSDFYAVPPADSLPPGIYQLQAGLFPPFQPGEHGWTDVTPLAVSLPVEPPLPVHELRAWFGAGEGVQWLAGYNAPESALPGSPVRVTLYWRRGPRASVTALGETRSLSAWPEGWIVPEVYELTAPAAGDYFDVNVAAGEPAHCGWLKPESQGCALPPIRLTGQALPTGAVNFADQLVLRRATLDTPAVDRGGVVRVTLEWQGLRAMAESYTVFVHLVGPDGQLYGQRDYWPVEGTRLTTTWQPGEVIRDPYTVVLPADAPPGDYTVHVGMYLLDTLERLPVLNADGLPADDKVVLTGLVVK